MVFVFNSLLFLFLIQVLDNILNQSFLKNHRLELLVLSSEKSCSGFIKIIENLLYLFLILFA